MDLKWEMLVGNLIEEFKNKEPGHCLRIDNLLIYDAEIICEAFIAKATGTVEGYILTTSTGAQLKKNLYIRIDQAIEKRNKKEKSICLFVPVDLVDAAMSSLGNSFRVFPLIEFFKEQIPTLRRQIRDSNDKLAGHLNTLIKLFKEPLKPTPEEEIDYYSSILALPELETAGEQLWRVGFVPDLSDQTEFLERLKRNREAVIKLIAPLRAHKSIEDRIASLNLMPNTIQQKLIYFLHLYKIQGNKKWLKEILETPYRGTLTFEQWRFPKVERSDLERLEIESFLDKDGNVKRGINLQQPGGPFTELQAECGPKKKLKVSWKSEPLLPKNVAYWQVQLIPSHDEYGDDIDFDISGLPSKIVSIKNRNVKLSLNIDPDTIEFKKAQVRIVPLDENEVECIKDEGNHVIWEALSDHDFWLIGSESIDIEDEIKRKGTIRSIPDALLRVAFQATDSEISLNFGPWKEQTLHYLPIIFNEHYSYKLGISPVLKEVQKAALENPDSYGYFEANSTGISILEAQEWEMKRLHFSGLEPQLIQNFLRARSAFFKHILSQEPGKILECIPIDTELDNRIRYYVQTYRDLIENTFDKLKNNSSEEMKNLTLKLFMIDRLDLRLIQGKEGVVSVSIILPTHPLRSLWYLSYAQLINHWVRKLTDESKSQRKNLLDVEAVGRLSPMNLPAFLPGINTDTLIFLDNIQFLYGLFIPVHTKDPASVYGEVTRVLGLEQEEVLLANLDPKDVSRYVQDYLSIHPYLNYLRTAIVNPGEGNFLAQTLRHALTRPENNTNDEENEWQPVKHLDIVAFSQGNLQAPLSGLNQLTKEFYETWGTSGGDIFRPLINIARCRMDSISNFPGGDVQILFCMDHFIPKIVAKNTGIQNDSPSVYGLMNRFTSDFKIDDNKAIWSHMVKFSDKPEVERHPERPFYTDNIIDIHKIWLEITGLLLDSSKKDALPCLEINLQARDLEIINLLHKQSDWVITIDRYLGIELFDNPSTLNPPPKII